MSEDLTSKVFDELLKRVKIKLPRETKLTQNDKLKIMENHKSTVEEIILELNLLSNDIPSTSEFDEKIKSFTPVNPSKLKITFNSIKGNEIAKKMLREAYVFPTYYPNLFPIKTKGVLLYGPPGTGKTLLAKACANELQDHVHFFYETASSMTSSYKNRTTKTISQLFADAKNNAEKDEKKSRSIIFLDEFDSIAMSRDKGGSMDIVTQLLQEMDGFGNNSSVSVIAATNYPWMIDDAILSRFSQKIFCDLPSHEAVVNIMQKYLAKNLFVKQLICAPRNTCNKLNIDKRLKIVNEIIHKQIKASCNMKVELKKFEKKNINCKNNDKNSHYFYALFDKDTLHKLAYKFITPGKTIDELKKLKKETKEDETRQSISSLQFGRSGRDITKVLEKAINLAATKAMHRKLWYKTDIVMTGVKCTNKTDNTMIISIKNKDNLEIDKIIEGHLTSEQMRKAYNFIICEKDIDDAIKEVRPSLNKYLYLQLLKYSEDK